MLEARNISKKFGGVIALSDISMELYPGKVNAIIGENGAGKSTLMKIFSGVYPEYEGEIMYNDRVMRFSGPKDAEKAGISIIHQELNLVPHLSITENIFLGREITASLGMLDRKRMKTLAKSLLDRVGLYLNPDIPVASLRVGQQQLVEIARALYSNASVIIMDEPTSAISDKEVDSLFSIVRQLRADQKTIVYISHKLKELFAIADRYVVLRDGTTVDSGDMADITKDELIRKMTGRKLFMEQSGQSVSGSEELLCVKNAGLKDPDRVNGKVLDGISFSLHEGEILGLYGLMGAGRTELMEVIFGLHPKSAEGEIHVCGKLMEAGSPTDAIRAGIAFVTEDRKSQGLFLDQSVRTNISITVLEKLQRWGLMLDVKKEKELSGKYIDSLSIKTATDGKPVKYLSGGNQQKVVLAKWLATHPKILLLDEPTRGVDINAKTEIYKLMKSLAAEGMGIIVVSSELPEILAVSDRVLVMCEGELTASIPIEQATEADILSHAIHKN